MSIQKPYGININNQVVDCSKDYLLKWKTSGDTSSSFAVSVYKNSDSSLVWSLPRTYSYAMSYTIPAGSIPNGDVYQLVVQVWNSANQTASSQPVIFTASSSPVVTVDTIGTVANNSYLFTAHYLQAENDPLSTYTVNLYNSDNVLLNTSGTMTDGLMEYRFDGLKSGQSYSVEFIVTSKKGLTSTSGLISFDVVYDNPSMYFELDAENLSESASMKLTWKIRQVVGKTTVVPVYVNNDEIDVRGGSVYFDEGFEIVNDFTLKIWFREIAVDTDLIYLKGSNGSIRLQYKTTDKCFHIYKTVNGWKYHYTYYFDLGSLGVFITPYQYIEIGNSSSVFLAIQQKNARMDIIAQ